MTVTPLFLPDGAGELFCIQHGSPRDASRRVLLLPPFAEEMNKSRRMFTLLGQALAGHGASLLVPDLYGTGDSRGEFGEASWERWLDDVAILLTALTGSGQPAVDVLAVRTGALLLGDCLARDAALRAAVRSVVFWQPVLTGAIYARQFLRLKLAAQMQSGESSSVAELLAESAAGAELEIAGYALAPALLSGLTASKLEATEFLDAPVSWFEVSSSDAAELGRASATAVDKWRAAGVAVDAAVMRGPQFWNTQEIAEAPALIERSVQRLVA